MGFGVRWFWLISLIWCPVCLGVSKAIDCELENKGYTLTVDKSGRGNFTKIIDAVNSIPNGNKKWIRILVQPGLYRERVIIGRDKPCIMLIGNSRKTTQVEFASKNIATLTSQADNFVAKRISFKNTFNFIRREVKKAVAAEIKGDKSSFYDCGFHGVQDTIWDATGRHYFENCVIEGAIDFIWGSGQSIYKNAHIVVNGGTKLNKGTPGYITAQGRSTEKERSGFVFLGGSVTGKGVAYLGRVYRPYSTVIFYKTIFSRVVHPAGWDSWPTLGLVDKTTYAEIECGGKGAKNSTRVPWEKRLTPGEIQHFANVSFVDAPEEWIHKQPS